MLRTLLFVAVVFLITAAVGTGATSAASSAGNDSIINMANSAIQTVNITPMIQLSDQCKQKLMAIFNGSATLGCTNMTKEQENTALQNWAAGCNVSVKVTRQKFLMNSFCFQDVFDGIFDSFNQTVTTMLEKQTTVVAEANSMLCAYMHQLLPVLFHFKKS
jgi:hypothetical protein